MPRMRTMAGPEGMFAQKETRRPATAPNVPRAAPPQSMTSKESLRR